MRATRVQGKAARAWRSYRDALGTTGFTFEYSATFGQALTAARNDQLTDEYGKAIVFDYSYRYFHGDGHGKDFRVLNLHQETTAERTETLLLGNLLSFHEQQRVFADQAGALRPYGLEKPLWIFVGSTVNAVYRENRRPRSDVLTVIRFLHHVLQNRNGRIVDMITRLLAGETTLLTPDGQDVFQDRFTYLKAAGDSADGIYRDILTHVFHATASGGLHLCSIRGTDGELGLRASSAHEYFGLVYIGDTSSFRKLVAGNDTGITLEEDVLAESLFDRIGERDTHLNILVGAKKFMEGWNSWRVSNMGLLNIGRQAGSEIIQLFGRGVRLRGKDSRLKRSQVLEGPHPDYIGLLETLDIFAVRANYMALFREYLEKEGVETDGYVEVSLPVQTQEEVLKNGLVLPRVPEKHRFAEEESLLLGPYADIRVQVDMSLKVQMLESHATGVTSHEAQAGTEHHIPVSSLDLIDWEQIYLVLLEYKQQRQMANLVVTPAAPRKILAHSDPVLYNLTADETVVEPRTFHERALLQEAATDILRNYMDTFYRKRQEQWETSQMEYVLLDEHDPNLRFNPVESAGSHAGRYLLNIKQSEPNLLSKIAELMENMKHVWDEESQELPRIHFDRHLYQPLLVEHSDDVMMSPPGLKPSERQFVADLKAYWSIPANRKRIRGAVYLLRNLRRGHGVGFFTERGFYPDFILWIKDGQRQHIVFLEPHGMIFAPSYQQDHKARLHEQLPDLAAAIGARTGQKDITLDSYIISRTPYEDLRKQYDDGTWNRERFTSAHILFMLRDEQDGYDYLDIIFREQAARSDDLQQKQA